MYQLPAVLVPPVTVSAGRGLAVTSTTQAVPTKAARQVFLATADLLQQV
jgi:hypothetical protein